MNPEQTSPLVTDDTSAPYMEHRTRLAKSSALEEMAARVKVRETAPPTKPGGAAVVPATSPAQGEQTAEGGGTVGGVVKDIALGATVQAPFAILKGVRDAYQNTIDLGKEVGDWVEQSFNLPVLFVDKEGIRVVSNEEAKGKRLSDLATLPDLDAPTTVTGGAIKGIAQFLTGMKGAGKLMKVAGVPEAGYSAAALKGAIANFSAFDPHQQRLSNLVEKFPILQNPVTEFLASDPNDGDAEGRFKNALEGFGFGLVTDGFVKGVKLLRSASIAKRAAAGADDAALAAEAVAKPRSLPEDAFITLGSEADNAPLVKVGQSKATVQDVQGAKAGAGPHQVPSSAAGRAAEPPQTFINYARVNEPGDVKRVMERLAQLGSVAPDSARAGKRTFTAMKLDAAHEDAWSVLSTRRVGQPLSDSESIAARQLWNDATNKVADLAEKAATNPSEANLFAFRKMLDVHDMVQREVLGARAATARAQASWRIPVGGGAERLRDVTAMLDQHGGSEVSKLLAERVAALGRAGLVKEMSAAVEKGLYAKTRDAVLEAWIGGLLSNPVTHLRNITSNSLFIPMNMAERATAARIANVLGHENGVQLGEASAQWTGLTESYKDAFRYAAKAGRTMQSGTGINRVELPRQSALSSEALGLSSTGPVGRAVDLLGSAYRLTSRGLIAEDEFFKTIGYRSEIHAQAVRQARMEFNAGQLADDAIGARVADLVANPPENIRISSVDQALYQTFQSTPGWFGSLLMKAKHVAPGFNVLLPFVRTTTNLARATFERTPLAPLVGQWRADYAAGGARKDLAIARMGLGSMATFAAADLTMKGQVTGRGPQDKGLREALMREGWKPYSVKIGSRWFTYTGVDPLSSIVGMAADTTEMLMHTQHELLEDSEEVESLVTATAAAMGGNLLNKSYLQGFSGFIEAMNDPQISAERYFQGLVSSTIPSGVGHVARIKDPYIRHVYSMQDALMARLPGLSDNLSPVRDMWGEPRTRDSGLGIVFNALSPITSQKPTPEPIDQEILRLQANITSAPKRTSFNGVNVDLSHYPGVYSRYVELAGNGAKDVAFGLGAKDYLNKLVSNELPTSVIYRMKSEGAEGGKATLIEKTIRDYRELARRQVLREFPELAADVEEKRREQQALKMPVLSQ